ncbi:glycoside hydrolase family 127 protein [Christiangramia forsetii]|nr:glycoside hydrolase family 127 protein [Christiangramia forsetii]
MGTAIFRNNLSAALLLMLSMIPIWGSAQQAKLKLFPHEDVQLLDSPFRDAMLVDLEYILKLDPDRLLAPFLKEAGLETKVESYPNWENTGLDGHIGGHYLTALSLMYAATGNQEVLERLNYMLDELQKVQQANVGYIGGVPDSKELWQQISEGNINAGSFSLNDRWVPLYNIHKTYAGLRDAYQIAGIERAKTMLIDLSDWMLEVTSDLSEEQIQELLISEYGGLNETFADVYEITGEKKYLDLAYAFSQKELLKPLEDDQDVLTGMHANTQIPKVIGFQTIAALNDNREYRDAASFFWDNVVNERSVAIGGNSVREHFHPKDDFSTMMSSVQGPETCNTYNMLKLSEKLFLTEANEKYVDYYEQALYNHILSSQHPEKGGFVYFTPMRPGHYRVYSQPETSFWCCVGSGLENHGKYNEFIYAHTENELYVNLFIPSILNWEEKGLKLTQKTEFPNEETSKISINLKEVEEFTLMLRYPTWAKGFNILVNQEKVELNNEPGSYVSIKREWTDGDEIELQIPMNISSVGLPDGSNNFALKYGPLVLGAKTGNEYMEGLFADASRGGHIAAGKKIPLSETPIFLADTKNADLVNYISKEEGELKFKTKDILYPEKFTSLTFEPFYQIHDSRYVIYLPLETPESLKQLQQERQKNELEEQKIAALTIDQVAPGEQQPESDHFIKTENSNSGINGEKHWRDASGWFSYVLKDENNEAGKVRITYYGNDKDRNFNILIDDILIGEEKLKGEKGDTYFTRDYILPKKLIEKKNNEFTIKFQAKENSRTAGIYEVRLMKIK